MKELVVALGERRYRIERWFYRHEGAGRVSDVAVGPDGLVHVLIRHDPLTAGDTGPAVVTLDSSGRTVARWGGEEISDAHMLRVAPDGRVFIVDRDAHCVSIFRDFRQVGRIGTFNEPHAPFNHPTSVAFAADGTILVADGYANHFVHRYDEDLKPIGCWGAHGRQPGAFRTPHAVWSLPDGRVAVVDRGNDRVQLFSADGEPLAVLDGFVQPMGIWGGPDGTLLVTDCVPSLTRIGADFAIEGRCRPVADGAHGLSAAADGSIYLAESGPGRVARLVAL